MNDTKSLGGYINDLDRRYEVFELRPNSDLIGRNASCLIGRAFQYSIIWQCK